MVNKKFIKALKLIIFYLEVYLLKYLINKKNKFMISKRYFKINKYKIMKKILLLRIFKYAKINISDIIVLLIRGKSHFGNFYIAINNAIIYCELLGCKKIIVGFSNKIFINNKIFCKKNNISIEPNQMINITDKNLLILNQRFFFYYNFKYFKNVNRLEFLKNQLLNNLPKVITHPDDLYIYIRGGDIFKKYKNSIKRYPQPPLCFYMKILNEFKFRKAIIISEDKLNPIISILLNKYSYLTYRKNNLKLDISFLSNSYNIAAGKSSFLVTIIKFNKKIKFLWEYDYYKLSERYLHLHYSVYKFSYHYTIYKLNSSKKYRRIMYPWHNSLKQRKIMLKVKCKNNFDIIRERLILG